jgi:bifunctional non-homologous end joining protein LigD
MRRGARAGPRSAVRGARDGPRSAVRGARAAQRVSRAPRTAHRAPASVEHQLTHIERTGGDGEIRFDDGRTLRVTSLDKLYFPRDGITKGELMRHYAHVAPVLLPILADRPLGLKRYPEGIEGHSFFQQNATKYPRGVRVERIRTETGEVAPRFVGGDLPTLLYVVQIGTIALHAWQSRAGSLDDADYSTIDLDPGQGVRFARVVELARIVGASVRELGLNAALKTSGSKGIHVAIPLPPGKSYAESTALARGIAERVVDSHPELATLERRIDQRPRGTVYVDVQQNARGKSVVSAYSARARPGATVSAPLRWPELTGRLRLERFTVRTMSRRLARVGDLWGDALRIGNRDEAIAKGLGR